MVGNLNFDTVGKVWIQRMLSFFLVCIFSFSCGDDHLNGPIGSLTAPEQITVREVENRSGSSVIYYDRPNDDNILYVKAVWKTDDEIEYNQTASFYTDSIIVDGFGEEGSYTVELFTVSSGEVYSDPVEVEVNPSRPPFLIAYDNLEITPTFSGIRVTTENPTKAKLAFRTFKKDESDEWIEIGTEYTLSSTVEYFSRGHEPDVDQEFRVQIRDKWGHWSPPVDEVCSPWFEKELPKNLFREIALCNLSGDGSFVPEQDGFPLPSNFWGHKMHSWNGSNVEFERLFDGEIGNSSQCYHTKPLAPLPQHFTIDLGEKYNLSRFTLWPRNDPANLFRGGHPQIIRLYGASYNGSDPEQLVDDIENREAWLDLGIFYLSRADGSFEPYPGTGDRTAEDNALVENGHEMTLNSIDQMIRYVRVQTIKCFSDNTSAHAVMIGEISFFGSD